MIDWKPGPPTTEGIYWYDTGLGWSGDTIHYPWIAQSRIYKDELHTHVFADFGSGPLSMIYNEFLFKERGIKPRHALIELPKKTKWKSTISSTTRRAWVKSSKGYIGFALVRYHGESGDIVWKDHPTDGCVCNEWFRDIDGYLFYPIEEPIL